MRAFALDGFGDAGSVRDLPVPEPETGQVRVRVQAAGVNPFDWAVVQGFLKDFMEHRFPLVPGSDLSGLVEAVGPGVEGLRPGDAVFGVHGKPFAGGGSFAEQVTASAGAIAPRPAELDPVGAAALPVAGVTALESVDALQLEPGRKLLVVGAAGGVGGFAVQLASGLGAHVVAVARRAAEPYVRELGAAEVVDRTEGDVAEAVRSRHPDGLDAVLDVASDQAGLARLAGLVREGGRVVSTKGAASQEAVTGRGLTAVDIRASITTAALSRLAALVAEGSLRLPEIRTVPLEQAGEALREVAAGRVRGKLVVRVA